TRIPKMASSAEFAEYVNQLDIEAGETPQYTEAEIQLFREGTDPDYLNTDWYGEVLKKSSFQSQHHLSVRGGSEAINFSVSGSYTREGSIFKNGSLDYRTYGLRSNLDAKISDFLKIGFDLNGQLENGNYPAHSTIAAFGALKQNPMTPVYWPNGLPSTGIEFGANPAILGTSLTGNNNIKTYRILAKTSFDLTVPWVTGLGIDWYLTLNNDNGGEKIRPARWTVYDYTRPTDSYIPLLVRRILTPELTESYSGNASTLINLRIQ